MLLQTTVALWLKIPPLPTGLYYSREPCEQYIKLNGTELN